MLKNYLTVAFRNLGKNKGFSAINIIGLAIGIATCLLITLYVLDDVGYDQFNTKASRIYRVDGDIQFGGNHFVLAVAPDPMGPTLKKDFPQVEQYVRFRNYGGFLVKKGAENIQENRVIYADSTLFEVFTLPMTDGDATTALTEPNSIVITESTARKYFNRTSGVAGKNFVINDTGNYKITGVIKDIPSQSHFHYDFFVSMATTPESRQNDWLSNNFNTYIVLKPGTDGQALEAQFDGLVEKYVGPQVKATFNLDLAAIKKSGNYDRYTLMPLSKIHLYSSKAAELSANSSIQYVYIFSAIALFILLIACVNFMNLSTARSANRAREVGVRKVLGSGKNDLIRQFLTESLLISFIALLLALAVVALLLPFFNQLALKNISFYFLSNPLILPLLLLVVVVTGLLAGSYPAFYLSSFQPADVLKGKLAGGFKKSWLRSSLVVFQFSISIVLIIGTIVIYRQLQYIQNKNIGYNRSQVLVLKHTEALGNEAAVFRQEVQKLAGVTGTTMTGFLPTNGWRSDSPLFSDATLDQKTAVSMQIWEVDEHYIPTLGMQLQKGRNFSKEMLTDSAGIIINEAAAKLLGFPDPLNKNLYHLTDLNQSDVKTYHIIGVVKNFNFNSLRDNVTPLALMLSRQNGSIAIRIGTKNIPALLSQIETKYKAMAPGQPFNYSFMDEDFNATYQAEQRMGYISVTFAIMAIIIACLGLFGLVTYAAEQRIREIGIRKVLGATVSGIVGMLSLDFLKLVVVSSLIAFPLAYYIMHQWLQDFAYRTDLSWWIFAVAGLVAVFIAFITIGYQAVKVALTNPVISLRSE